MQSFLANRPSMSLEGRPVSTSGFVSRESEGFQPLFAARMPECRNRNTAMVEAELVDVAPAPKVEPRVELVSEGGVVRKIVVTCGCGDRIELECQF